MISGLVLSLLVAAASCATGGVVPTAPGPGQSFKEGGDCSLSWNLDTTGKWTSFSVDLMSGSNTAMQVVTNVFKDRDGTKGETSHTWKCPSVTPHSAIYFYQFTQAGADTTWTTRMAITSLSGDVTAPANSLQPNGAQIPWGIGHLAGAGAEATTTTAPTSTANTTALNTPALTTNTSNPTVAPAAAAGNTSTVGTTGSTPTSTTGSTASPSTGASSGTNPKTPSTSSPVNSSPQQGSNNTPMPTSDAHTLTLCKSAAVALSLAAVLIAV